MSTPTLTLTVRIGGQVLSSLVVFEAIEVGVR